MADKLTMEVIGIDKTKERFNRKHMDRAVLNSMKDLGNEWERETKFNLSGKVLKAPTGNYRSHVFVDTKKNQNSNGATTTLLTQNVPYAEIHEFGGIVKKPAVSRVGTGLPPYRFIAKDGTVVFTFKIKAHTIKIPKREPIQKALKKALKLTPKIFAFHFNKEFNRARP